MTIKEILENYQEYYLQVRYGTARKKIREVFEALDRMFRDEELIKFECASIKIIELYYKDNMTAEQIAEKLDITPRTVYRRRDKALEKLSWVFDDKVGGKK